MAGTRTRGKCPFEWAQTPSGTCYYFAEHNATWREGRAYCRNQGATMLDIHSNQEKEFITERMVGSSWLGLRRKNDEMEFKWISGAKMNYTQWEELSITAPAREAECALMGMNGLWVYEPCERNHGDGDEDLSPEAYVICEYLPVYNPFVLIGPVVISCGLIVLVLSIEICIRRKEFKEKNPEVMIDDEDEDIRHVSLTCLCRVCLSG
ncbi:hypothetical protein SK128_027838 [Halocaridina rubra]|uniref:C-type lectin domain-containing protein n=1 Tax=Halocaridina rubra TaxID=373956 RepID=A0AAN8WG13_HALRR